MRKNKMTIDWAYLRKGWTSCKKAQEFLDEHKQKIVEITDARKERIDDDKAWQMLAKAKTVSIA